MAAVEEARGISNGFAQFFSVASPASVATPAARALSDDLAGETGRSAGGQLRNSFLRFDFGQSGTPGPPPRAYVLDARLRLTAAAAQSDPVPATVALVARDGLWDLPGDGSVGWGLAPGNDAQVAALTGLFAPLSSVSWSGGAPVDWPYQDRAVLSATQTLGQAWLATASDALGFFAFTARRTGSRPGVKTFCDLYAAAANDGSDDRPSGPLLATSVDRGFDLLPTVAGGATAAWDFRPASPAIVAGNRYVSMCRHDGAAGAPVMQLKVRGDAPYAGGSLVLGGVRNAFSEVHYPEQGLLPHLYEADGATPRTAPHGGTVDLDLPAFPGVGVDVEIPGLARLVQQWVNDPLYADDRTLAVQVAARAGAAPGALRQWSASELRVLWRPRNTYVG